MPGEMPGTSASRWALISVLSLVIGRPSRSSRGEVEPLGKQQANSAEPETITKVARGRWVWGIPMWTARKSRRDAEEGISVRPLNSLSLIELSLLDLSGTPRLAQRRPAPLAARPVRSSMEGFKGERLNRTSSLPAGQLQRECQFLSHSPLCGRENLLMEPFEGRAPNQAPRAGSSRTGISTR